MNIRLQVLVCAYDPIMRGVIAGDGGGPRRFGLFSAGWKG